VEGPQILGLDGEPMETRSRVSMLAGVGFAVRRSGHNRLASRGLAAFVWPLQLHGQTAGVGLAYLPPANALKRALLDVIDVCASGI
jgi:hypothetical protein